MTDYNRAFREYATRVSFSLSMSRNQVAVLREIVLNLEAAGVPFDQRPGSVEARDRRRALYEIGVRVADNYIVGMRWLIATGLLFETPEHIAERVRVDAAKAAGDRAYFDYAIPHYKLTPAGEHIVGLLRCAGLIPECLPVSTRKRRAA